MSWETNRKHIGEVKSGKSIRFKFKYLGKAKIKKIKVGCGSCTTAKMVGNDLNVMYTPGSFPKHLTTFTRLVTKNITVIYEDNNKEILFFTAKVLK